MSLPSSFVPAIPLPYAGPTRSIPADMTLTCPLVPVSAPCPMEQPQPMSLTSGPLILSQIPVDGSIVALGHLLGSGAARLD